MAKGPAATGRGALVRSSAMVAVGTALSRLTGLLRIAALLWALDQTRLTDVFNLANTMPNLVYELLLGGILSATLVPLFTERLDDDDGGTSAIVSTVAVALVVVTVLGVVVAPWVMGVYADGIQDPRPGEVEAYREVGTTLLRFLMPQVLFYGLVTVVTALLHARRRFAAPAYAPVLNNVLVSALLFALPTIVGRSVRGEGAVVDAQGDTTLLVVLGLGATAGVAAMALAMVPSVVRAGVSLRFSRNWRHPAVRQMVRLSGWTLGYVAANQVALYVVYFLANARDAGDLTAYTVAFTFFQLPHGLFAVSLMTTFMPELTVAAQSGDHRAFRERFTLGLRLMALVILPASAGYVALAQPIVGLLPIRGASIETTSSVLAAFAVGLFGFSVYLYALRGFYARKDTRTPFFLNVAENGANIALALPLVVVWGVAGLSAAYSAAYLLAAVLAVRSLGRRVGGLGLRAAAGSLLRMAIAAVGCGAAAWLASRAVADVGPVLVEAVVGVVAGAAAYGVLLFVLRVEEVDTVVRMVRGRLRRAQS
ncbi:murein biosynthesis integral membrane protein MurJ [Actinomarinicola tropica]|nr:murein biosynthesis integral membrane protein MurJ [Actinomarinicola tropica]